MNVLGEPAALKANNGSAAAGISAQALAAQYGGKWGKRAVTAAAVAQLAWPAVKAAREWYRSRNGSYTLTIHGEDMIYADIHAWVMKEMAEEERRSMSASTEITYGDSQNDRRRGELMAYDPHVELVVDKSTGRLTHCYALDDNESRVAELPITEARERYDVSGPGIVSIDIHSFRVKRTEANAV